MNRKKAVFITAVLLGLCGFCRVSAADLSAFDKTIEKEMVAAAVQSMPTKFASAEKQAAFNYYLAKSVEIVDQWAYEDARELWVMSSLEYALRTIYNENKGGLTADQERAVKYALFVLMFEGPEKERYAKYRPYLDYTRQYQDEHPVQSWSAYKQDCQEAMDTFYDVLKELVDAAAQGEAALYQHLNQMQWTPLTH